MAHLKEAYAVMGRKVVNSAANSLPHDSRRRMMFEGIEQAMVDEDIGLPTMSDGMSSTGSIWDELDPVRGQQHSVPPQDPGPNSPTMTVSSNGQSMLSEQEVARRRLKEIQEELMFTLASRAGGYVSLNDLKRDFSIDTGFIPDRVAQDYGFNSFEDFVNDDQMKTVVKVEIVDDQPVYVPRDCSRFRHIRDEQIYSNETTVKKEEADDWEKMARALLPQNQERYIHGKKVILRILHELGGETKHILWVRIQEQYKRETGKELSGNELRSMFQRDKAIKILTKLFQSEVEVTDAEQAQGHFYVKLKKPYDEILRCFDEVLHAQREAFAKFKNKRRYNNNNTFGQPQRKLTLEERFPPVATGLPTSIDQSVYMEQSTSQRIAMESLPNNNAQQENDNVDDETGLPNTNNNTKVKFGLPVDIKKPKMGDRSDSPLPAEPTARKQRFNWDATTLPSFEGERESNGNVNAPTAKATDTTTSSNNSPNGTSANNNNNNKKQQYTTRTADGNYTDSEAEADDEDDNASEVTIMDADEIAAVAGGGTSANSKQQKKPPLHIPAPPAFNPNRQTPVAVGEQPIVANKPMEMKSAGDPMQNVRKTRVNVAPQRQINALRDDDDDMETGLPRVPSMMPQRPSAAPINNNRASGMAQQQQPFMSSGSTSAPINNNCGSRMAQQQQQSFMSSGSTTRVFNPGPFAASATEMLSSSRGGMSEPVNGFALMDHVDDLRLMANRLGCSHETRHDEGTFAFRRDDKLLIFTEFITEFNESKVRGSWHKDGHIYQERYFPKVDWPMFYATIRGLLSEIYEPMADSPLTNNSEEGAPVSSVQLSPTKPWGCPPNLCNDHVDDDHHRVVQWGCPPGMAQLQQITPISDAQLQPLSKRRSNTSIAHQSVWVLPKVPRKCRSANPPFPAYKQTVNGLDFLAFFTKIFGFSNHYPAQFHIEGDHFCCSEQYYMFHKAKLFGYEITAAEIMETSDTSTIKRLGTADTLRARQKMGMEPSARTFDHDEWREVKEGVMFNALRAKFGQNRMLQQMLLDTGDALLVEASPSDQYWGIGCAIDSSDIENTGKWRGDNRLGILLMRLRQKLHWN